MTITYSPSNERVVPRFKRRIATLCLQEVAKELGRTLEEINYLFMSDEELLVLNRQYLNHNYYTDILTFDTQYEEEDSRTIRGDIAISLDRVRENAFRIGLHFEDELFRVMAHGILHLCGLDDHTPEDDLKMRIAEDHALHILKKKLGDTRFFY